MLFNWLLWELSLAPTGTLVVWTSFDLPALCACNSGTTLSMSICELHSLFDFIVLAFCTLFECRKWSAGHVGYFRHCGGGRGVTRLDGARRKKQFWRPHVRTWGLSEVNVLYWRKYLWHCWDFSAPPAVIRRTHNDSSPGSCALLPPRYAPGWRVNGRTTR